ncbi:hypothetical protein CLU85_1691 [Acidovorax sp. 69]|uniref:hypothetical protein n=1 Tax=Acidovorax sp. 69 TaxID=2035202 RepID=UPI000CACE796|nr:hypothetical protein [Acidovorax sp. 69]PJI96934.1 hypothetical protein CLU85_1691 [Acidovorax sp. 69]
MRKSEMPGHLLQPPPAYSAQLSARYRNFLAPLLTLGVLGGLNALLVAQSATEGAGWWPVAWLAAMFLGVFFSAVFVAIAGRRKLPVAYCIALSAVVGLALTTFGILNASLHAPWGAALPLWVHSSAPVRAVLESPWTLLAPYLIGLALHGVAMQHLNLRLSPENRG